MDTKSPSEAVRWRYRPLILLSAIFGMISVPPVLFLLFQNGNSEANVGRETHPQVVAWAFGALPAGKPVQHTFQITNRAPHAIEIQTLRSSCGCIDARCERRIVPSGDTFEVAVIIGTPAKTAHVRQSIAIDTKTVRNAYLLVIEGDVVEELVILPQELHFNQQRPIRDLRVLYYGKSELDDLEVRGEVPWISVTASPILSTPLEQAASCGLAVRKQWLYRASVDFERCPIGTSSTTIKFRSRQHSPLEMSVPVFLTRQLPLEVVPNRLRVFLEDDAATQSRLLVRHPKNALRSSPDQPSLSISIDVSEELVPFVHISQTEKAEDFTIYDIAVTVPQHLHSIMGTLTIVRNDAKSSPIVLPLSASRK